MSHLIVVETENAAYVGFEEATAVQAKPAQTGCDIYAKPDKKNTTSNAADIYSSVDKSKRKGVVRLTMDS